MADKQAASSAAAEGTTKRKLSQLRPKSRKKLKQQQHPDVELPPEEKQRRQEQKRQRELALKLRAEGRSYDPKVFKKKKKQQGGGNKHPKAKVKIKPSQRNKAPYHVIILPIAWHQRKEESARIVTACEMAEQLLQAAGLTCRIDDGDKFSPGQKMKYWELRGVGVRLEIGPKESLAGTAVLAVAAASPGQVANKSSVKVAEPQLTQRVKQALQQLGEQLPRPGAAAADEVQQQQHEQQEKQAGDQAAATQLQQPAEQLEGPSADQPKKKKRQKDKGVSQQGPAAAAAASGQEGPSIKNAGKPKDRELLKAQLATLLEEQEMTANVADKVAQQAASDSQHQQEQQQPKKQSVATSSAQPQFVSGDALADDFEWTAEDEPRNKKDDKKKRQKHADHERGGTENAAQTVKPKKPRIVKF